MTLPSPEDVRAEVKAWLDENWNPDLQAPLTQPGVNVKAGDYILSVNGVELHANDEIFSFFEETAGKQVLPLGILAIHPPGEVQQELLKDALEEVPIAAA